MLRRSSYDGSVEPSEPARVLKQSPARSVRLELPAPSSLGAPRVVKRFQSRGPLGRARDGARARREMELLRELHGRGLPVPRPLALEERDGGWEVEMEHLAGALPFAEILAGRAAWPAAPADVARELGQLSARLAAAGVDHPDLHPGNALLDGFGRAFAIDFHKARLVRQLGAEQLEGQLARMAQGARERTSRRFRARFLWAWWSALPAEIRPDARSLPELARRIEARARRERAEVVERRRPRWTRPGTAVRAVQLTAGAGFERVDSAPGLARAIEAEILLQSFEPGSRRILRLRDDGTAVLAHVGPWREVRALWRTAGRLEEHALPSARPLAIARGARSWAAFDLPPEGHIAESWDELREPRTLQSIGALAAAFHDRGVRPGSLLPQRFWLDGNGDVRLTVVRRLDLAFEVSPRSALEPWLALLAQNAQHATTMASGFLAALDVGCTERRELRAALRVCW